MKYTFFIFTVLLLPVTLIASNTSPEDMPSGTYKLDKTHASLTWKVSHLGLSKYTARFTDFDASIQFDANNITQSQVTATINPASVKTDYPHPEKKDFDQKLTGKQWFNAEAFPAITFTSTQATRDGNSGTITGDLTFLGVTKAVTLHATFNGAYAAKPFSENPALGFSAHTTIKRSDWGFDTYVPSIGDEVEIVIEAEFEMKN